MGRDRSIAQNTQQVGVSFRIVDHRIPAKWGKLYSYFSLIIFRMFHLRTVLYSMVDEERGQDCGTVLSAFLKVEMGLFFTSDRT